MNGIASGISPGHRVAIMARLSVGVHSKTFWRVLPDVYAQQRRLAVRDRVVLVGAAFHRELAGLVHAQPRPAAAESGQRGLGEGFLELVSIYTIQVNQKGWVYFQRFGV